jgi:catechol 2,3-dioxygenase-like lactoylglutathione lyase family enzyme
VNDHRWTPEELLAHEVDCTLGYFDAETAWQLGRAVLRAAADHDQSVTVRVARGTQILFHAAMEGTSTDQDDWLRRKVNTVARFGHSSQYVAQKLEPYGAGAFNEFGMSTTEYVLAGGAVPIHVDGAGIAGAIAVAGLSGEDDHALAVEAVSAVRASTYKGTFTAHESSGIPTIRSVDHVAYTVPDLVEAIDFFVRYLGGELAFTDGPFSGDYMRTKLNVDPSASCRLAMIRMGATMNLELFEYQAPDRRVEVPRNSDIGGGHLALYVDDVDLAYEYLTTVPGVIVQEGPNGVAESSPVRGQRWFYFLTPWGMQMEITSDATARGYRGLPGARLALPSTWDYS